MILKDNTPPTRHGTCCMVDGCSGTAEYVLSRSTAHEPAVPQRPRTDWGTPEVPDHPVISGSASERGRTLRGSLQSCAACAQLVLVAILSTTRTFQLKLRSAAFEAAWMKCVHLHPLSNSRYWPTCNGGGAPSRCPIPPSWPCEVSEWWVVVVGGDVW